MLDIVADLLKDVSWRKALSTVVDVLIVYYLIYRAMLLIRGTRALQMLIGILFALFLYFISQEEYLDFTALNWALDKFVSSFLVIIIILFQPDIRRALSEVGKNPLFLAGAKKRGATMWDEIVNAVVRMSALRIGALIVFERDGDLSYYTEGATPLDAKVTANFLVAIFIPSHENNLHDGAVIIRNGRVSHAGCFLPLSENPKIDKSLGTRHRAAIGVTEGTDAVVIVVSEESGIVSIANNGELRRGLDASSLKEELTTLFGAQSKKD